ncbi:MAG TPA: chemotaxis protein CheB, partial [Candidatus Acidoferrum sp.]|nr:chemotaxis protein CheB [Candidatus Acidoferrum sp.]
QFESEPQDGKEPLPFLVVAVGASAGGLEAFTELLRTLPADTGMAFILIQHLDPKHRSILSELVAKETKMPALEVTNGMQLKENHVYVIPPNASMSLSDHTLRLERRPETPAGHMPIDHFMRSLAQVQGKRAIGVLLSGSGTDGTLGMAEIQANGGVTFAQDSESAKFQDMPRSAIQANCVDYVLAPKSIAKELARIAHHPYIGANTQTESGELGTNENRSLNSIFQLLRKSAGVDFTHYRKTTILRRIQRRMVVHKLDRIGDYVRYVHSNPSEIGLLYKDMLINVTSFFRNPPVFDALKTQVFPSMLKNRESETPIRIWTPGCASGEETYSVAISLLEYVGDKAPQIPIQLFGTDLSESSIIRARSGFYPENIQVDVSSERLTRFFTKVEGGYRISKTIRDMCIFAQHNILNDPPFSQIDLIGCRNLFIYLEPELQHRVLALFHYSLRHNGFLVMGTSEGVGSSTDLYSTEDRVNKIFSKKVASPRALVTFSVNPRIDYPGAAPPAGTTRRLLDSTANYVEMQKEFDRRLLSQFSPAAVFVTEDLEIVHTRGEVNQYLALSTGRPSFSLLKMAPEGMLLDLRNAIARAKKELRPVRRENIRVKKLEAGRKTAEQRSRMVNFEVVPLRMTHVKQLYLMVIFEEARQDPRNEDSQRTLSAKQKHVIEERTAKLEQDLAATKEYLQSVIESQEATNEELQSANEEILSSNEELQSTNEELETAKEELQSANEELATVNDELRSRNAEIVQVNNDLTTLLSGIDLAVVLVGTNLALRRFTPAAEKLLGLIPADVGRPVMNINPTLPIPEFQTLISRVMSEGRPAQKQLGDSDGRQYKLRITPYRSNEDTTNGCVITVVDITTNSSN